MKLQGEEAVKKAEEEQAAAAGEGDDFGDEW
jgi:hypothetical protein